MNRSTRFAVGAAAVAPLATALAVAAAPAHAAPAAPAAPVQAPPAKSAPGPSTGLLYEAAASADPVTRALPGDVVRTAGQAAEAGTGTVDGVLSAAPGARTGKPARCALAPGRTVNSRTETNLPEASIPVIDRSPVGDLAEGTCLTGTRHRAADGLTDSANRLPGALTRSVRSVNGAVHGAPAPGARRAEPPLSITRPSGLPDVTSLLDSASPEGLRLDSLLLPPAARYVEPGPAGGLAGRANGTVRKAGGGLGGTKDDVGGLVRGPRNKDRPAKPGDGPLSMPNAPGLGLPELPGIG